MGNRHFKGPSLSETSEAFHLPNQFLKPVKALSSFAQEFLDSNTNLSQVLDLYGIFFLPNLAKVQEFKTIGVDLDLKVKDFHDYFGFHRPEPLFDRLSQEDIDVLKQSDVNSFLYEQAAKISNHDSYLRQLFLMLSKINPNYTLLELSYLSIDDLLRNMNNDFTVRFMILLNQILRSTHISKQIESLNSSSLEP